MLTSFVRLVEKNKKGKFKTATGKRYPTDLLHVNVDWPF